MTPTAFSTQEAVNELRSIVAKAKPGETVSILGCDRMQLTIIGSTYLREYGGTWQLRDKSHELVVGGVTVRFVHVADSFVGHHILLVK